MSQTDPNVVVEAVGLSKIYKDFWNRPKATAVNGVDFEIRQGEVLGFLGPNGSGKSTTVKMLLGLLNPTSGSLRVFDRSPNDVHIKKRIGYLPEESYLYKYLTAEETLDFFATLFNISADERKRRTQQLLDMVGLSKVSKRPVGEFSKGMARRVGLAQSLVNDPDLVILDEPTSGLDPVGCREVKDIIKTLKERNKTVVLCSHLLADVEDICDNVLIMYGGKVRARGSLSDLLADAKKTRITAPSLSPELMQRVMDLLNDVVESDRLVVDTPTMSLEEFFLDVVNQARLESVQTAGAEGGGQIAEYLKGEAKSPDELLASLAADAAAESPEQTEPAPTPANEPEPDVDRLAALADQEEPAADPEAEEDAKPKETQDVSAANARIEQLLGGSEKD